MAIGARALGILDEIARQIGLGRPEEVAERIAEGKLDMRPEAIIERQEDLFPTTAFHGGGDDIRIVDPNRVTTGKTANTGFFMSSSPVNAASYADRAGNIMPLAVDTRGFDVVNAGYNDWNRITNPDYLLGGERLATFGELPGYRGTMEPGRGIFDLNVVRDFDTDELARTARRFGSPGLIVQNVSDVGPNYKAFDPAFEAMTGLRVGDEGYQEALDTFFTDTIVASDPTRVRSLFAAFDPEYKGSNILGGAATAAVGAGLLAAPEEAEAGVLSNLIKAGYPEEVAQRIASGELPMDYASRMERALSQDHDIHEGLLHGSTHNITNFDASLTQQQNDLGQGIYLTDRPFDVNTNYAGEGPDLTNRIERLADELESTMESSWSWNADFWDELPGGPQGKLADEIESLIEEGEYRSAAEKASKALSKGDNEGVVYPLTVSKAGMADSSNTVPMPEYFDEAIEDLGFDANDLSDEQYDEVMDRVYELEADDVESPIAKAINIAAEYGADFPAYNIEPGMTTFEDMHRYFQMTEAYDDAGEVVGGGRMMNEWLRDLGYTGYIDRTTPEKFSGMGAGVHTIVFPGEEKNIRSLLSAAYDPKYTGPNILGGSAAAATGLGLLGMPQESFADTAARIRAQNDTSGAYAPRSETLQDVTMALRGLERRLEGNPASLLFPSGYVQHLEEFNRPYERSTFTGALLGALDFL